MIQKEQSEDKIYQTNFHRHLIQQEEQEQVYYPSFSYRLDTRVHWLSNNNTFYGHLTLGVQLETHDWPFAADIFRAIHKLQLSKLFCHWLTWGKRETSRTDLNDNALLTKGTDIIAPCMSEITSTYNICKSSTTSIRPGKMEKQAHTNGRMKEFWRYL